jgi:phage/conjugal plasmid C-4 type zinc finger TraR family protein
MDDADKGSKNTAFFNDLAVAAVRAGIASGASTRPSAFYCANCDEPIPQARREAEPGCTLCVACQAELERR